MKPLEIGDGDGTLAIYPNPSLDGWVKLGFGSLQRELVVVETFNSTGQKVADAKFFEGQESADLQLPGAGVFNLKISLGNGRVVNKRVVSLK